MSFIFNLMPARKARIFARAQVDRDPARMGNALGTPHFRLGPIVMIGLDQDDEFRKLFG